MQVTLLIMSLLITDFLMALLITVNKKHVYKVAFINVISKLIISKIFKSIVIVSLSLNLDTYAQNIILSRHRCLLNEMSNICICKICISKFLF